ncbi:hypothetical protein ACFCP7_00400 [Paenibacillus elgii]
MKPLITRISYYTRKVNQHGARRFDYIRGRSDRQPPANRAERLYQYRDAMYRRIQATKEGGLLC